MFCKRLSFATNLLCGTVYLTAENSVRPFAAAKNNRMCHRADQKADQPCMKRELIIQLLRFGVVGSTGFAIDGTLLSLLIMLGLNPFVGRLISFPTALMVTWALNRNWTFGATKHAHRKGHFQRYVGVQLFGMLCNYSTYSLVLLTIGTEPINVFFALVCGSFVGMFLNFTGARYIAFRT